jgi:HPt (histidine-containing phosphotransfer) domain-containing protein
MRKSGDSRPIAPCTDTATRLRAASQALMGTTSGSKFCQLLEQAAIELESLSGPWDELEKCRDLLRRAHNELLPGHESEGWPEAVIQSAEKLMDEISEYVTTLRASRDATHSEGDNDGAM